MHIVPSILVGKSDMFENFVLSIGTISKFPLSSIFSNTSSSSSFKIEQVEYIMDVSIEELTLLDKKFIESKCYYYRNKLQIED